MRAAAGKRAPAAVDRFAATQLLTIQAARVPALVMHQLRVAVPLTQRLRVAVADIPAVVVDM
jgi:hypothetical protein